MTHGSRKINRLWGYLRPYWHIEALTFLDMAVLAGLTLALPVAVRYNETPEFMTASRQMGRYNKYYIKVELHFPRGVLQESYALALACIEPYQNLYAANLSISGTCDVCNFREPPYDGPLELRYKEGHPVTIGVIFYLWVKEMLDDVTVNL